LIEIRDKRELPRISYLVSRVCLGGDSDIWSSEYPSAHRDPCESCLTNRRDVPRKHAADHDAGSSAGKLQQGERAAEAERRSRVKLGAGLVQWTYAPIGGAHRTLCLRRGSDRGANPESARCSLERQLGREIVGTQMDAMSASGKRHLESIIHEDGYGDRRDQSPSQSGDFSVTGLFEPELDRRRAARDCRPADGQGITSAEQAVVGHQEESQRRR
jgi:hypothetical protein